MVRDLFFTIIKLILVFILIINLIIFCFLNLLIGTWYINVPTQNDKRQYNLTIFAEDEGEIETIYTNQQNYVSIPISGSTFKVYLRHGYLTTLNISEFSSNPSGTYSKLKFCSIFSKIFPKNL